jgi:L-ascorbate metabolism protein UlaG (beta-lactamase superfamily)
MQIQWFGQSCFRLQTPAGSVLIDPFSKEIGITPPKVNADIVIFSHKHPDHYNDNYAQRDVFIIDGPGEYEKNGFSITGVAADHDDNGGKKSGKVTIFRVESEGLGVVFLSDIGKKQLEDGQLEGMGEVDILLVPIGGKYNLGKNQHSTVDAEGAAELVNQLEPSIVIPMHYKIPGLKLGMSGSEEFLKEMGSKNAETLDKLSIKKKDLLHEKTKIVVLKVS